MVTSMRYKSTATTERYYARVRQVDALERVREAFGATPLIDSKK